MQKASPRRKPARAKPGRARAPWRLDGQGCLDVMVEVSAFGDTPRPAGRLEATPNRIGRATDTELLKRLCGSGHRERGVHVRTLPDSPSLDYLRRQAKDLLVGMRQARPESLIQLADAQTALAQQYGFGTWPELKAEVDRRHGGAQIAEPALAQRIATRFGLGIVTAAMKSVAPANDPTATTTLQRARGTVESNAPRPRSEFGPQGRGPVENRAAHPVRRDRVRLMRP